MSVTLSLEGLDSMQHAECRMSVESSLGLHVFEDDRDEHYNLDASVAGAILAGVQCILGAASIWIVRRSKHDKVASREQRLVTTLKSESFGALDLEADEVADVLGAATSDQTSFRLTLRHYTVTVTQVDEDFHVRGGPSGT